MEDLTVHTTYLALSSPVRFRPALLDDPNLLVLEAHEPLVPFYRWLYSNIGWTYQWEEHAQWDDETLDAYLARPEITVLVLYLRGTPIGFLGLDATDPDQGTEVAHLGILPAFQGRGLGKHLLTTGVQRAFDDGAARVWLHTDNFDGPQALANYLARGFEPFRTTTHQEPSYPPGEVPGPPTYAYAAPIVVEPPPDANEITVTTTYLAIPSRAHFQPALLDNPDLLLLPAQELLPAFYRFLYSTVGNDCHWIDRLPWTDEMLRAHLMRPTVTVLVLYLRGTPAGYIELEADSIAPGTEVAYFGLFPPFRGRGLGKHLLSAGVQRAFDDGADRVWVHTCSLDGPHALANYRATGFQPYCVTTHQQWVATSCP